MKPTPLPRLRGHLLKVFRSTRGAFDLPSIIVGVVVVGILAAGVLAAVFGVIPFAQDNAARQDLDSVRTAEGVAKAKSGTYMDKAGLVDAAYISTNHPRLAVGTDPQQSCYLGLSKSGTGKIYYSDNKANEAKELVAGDAVNCLTAPEIDALVVEVGGYGPSGTDPTAAPSPTESGGGPGNAVTTLAGWGGNWDGEQGDGTYDAHAVPSAAVTGILAGKHIDSFANSGSYTMCAISEGAPYCWGYGSSGQLGVPFTPPYVWSSAPSSATPVAVDTTGAMSGTTTTKISVGKEGGNVCAVASGKAYCWGNGQNLGTANPKSYTPQAVDDSGVLAGKTATDISVSGEVSCAIADGNVYCWGYNGYGNLGNGSNTDSATPVAVDMSGALSGKKAVSITSGYGHTCVIADDAQAYCWGVNGGGELGDGTTADSNVPVQVGGFAGKTVTKIDGNTYNTCAIASGEAYCWGDGTGALLGNGVDWTAERDLLNGSSNTANASTTTLPSPVDTSGVLNGLTVTEIKGGDESVCAVASGGVYCWGSNESSALGNNTTGLTWSPTAVTTAGTPLEGKTVTSILAGGVTTLAIYQ